MFKIKIICTCILLSAVSLSCDSLLGIDITKKPQMEKFWKKSMESLPQGASVHEINFRSADQRSKGIMGVANIIYTNDNEAQLRQIAINLSSWSVLRDGKLKLSLKETCDGVSSDFMMNYDFGELSDLCRSAIDMLKEHKMKYAGIEYFTVLFCNEVARYEFVVDGRPEKTPITTKGRYSGVYYHEVYFSADYDKQLNMDIRRDLKIKREGI